MTMAPQQLGIGIRRHFTTRGVHPYSEAVWDIRDARITNFRDGSVAFEQVGVEVPRDWSLNATNILAQKYFRGTPGTAERETSLRQVVDRIVDTIAGWGSADGYFVDDEETAAFSDELKHLIVHQKVAFNSPVWFNIGVRGVPQQASACQPYDALVCTPDGLIPIGRLVEENAIGAKVMDAHGLTRIVAVRHNGTKEVLRLHTKAGHQLDVTADHLVYRVSGTGTGRFHPAGELRPGDKLQWHRVYMHGSAPFANRDIAEAALAGWLQSDGFVGGEEMIVPSRLYEAPLPLVAAYLRSLFQAEGYVSIRQSAALIGLDMISEGIVRGVQKLLARFGIFSRVRFKEDRRPDRKGCWSLSIRTLGDRKLFAEEIGFIDDAKAGKLEASFALKGFPIGATKTLEVARIESLGDMSVYDIQTESGEYLSQGLRVHNCFILAVEDSMPSILNWYTEEGTIFKGGSGSGINLSTIRSSKEGLKGGGTASGPVSFMRGADASAGTIKSGGKTRRAAKMVILNADHPDVEDFIWCKAVEERKARVLRDAGFDMDLDGKDNYSLQYQNANNSVRVTDEFMQAVLDDSDWHLRSVRDGVVVETVKARDLFHQIGQAAWECADPGMQFDSTINNWHTAPETGRINASNPCSEYMHLDNSACNLASLNLMKFIDAEGIFGTEGFKAAIEVIFTAQEILVGNADYPTQKIAETSRRFRQLGLGYANLGALLMAEGHAYDSDEGRAWAGAITALMTGHAYAVSARTAARMGPFAGYHDNADAMLNVLRMHRAEAAKIDETKVPVNLLSAAQEAWDTAVELGETYGVRNSQATVLAPTGTIGLLMDCDTTGIEPDLGLVKTKKLVGGGTMSIVNQTVPRALANLGYSPDQVDDIVSYVDEHKSILGAPHLSAEHLTVFACSMGDNVIHYMGHIKMMAAVQPFISGAISKTVNLPEDVTVGDVEDAHMEAWRLGLKAIAIYRDNCKVAQPLATTKKSEDTSGHSIAETARDPVLAARVEELERLLQTEVAVKRPMRERLPRRRRSSTFHFRVADCEGYVTVGEYEDGRPGEVFMKVSKQGSTLAGIMDAFSIAVSLGLQHGVPLATFVRKYTNMRFDPAGMTDDPDLRIATSLVDYIFRRLAVDYLSIDEREELGILTTEERLQPTLPGVEEAATPFSGMLDGGLGDRGEPTLPLTDASAELPERSVKTGPASARTEARDAPYCYQCGNVMQRSGSCYVCPACGTTSGCS